MKVLINAVSAKLGGAATYMQNLAHALPEQSRTGDSFLIVAPPGSAVASHPPWVRVEESKAGQGSYAGRWWWDQVSLRALVEREKPDVLFSSANFAMLRCPCPQVLLVRNPIYFSQEYLTQILPKRGLALRAETAVRRWLVAQSVRAATCLMTPSRAMLDDLARFVPLDRNRVVVNPYGVPRTRVRQNLRAVRPAAPLKLLWVSHYADHKNLMTLLRAVEKLRSRLPIPIELILTLDAQGESGQHTSMPEEERALLRELGPMVRQVGVQSYEGVWRLYEECDVFVFPSLIESFGHPLVEAMAAQLPIVASNIPIHREICGSAARWFTPSDDEELAGALQRLLESPEDRAALAAVGRERVKSLLWEDHVARLLDVFRVTAAQGQRRAA
jgi:glycosyltransferase involved in cell wall biosynthesis